MDNLTEKFLIQEPKALEMIGQTAAKIAYYNFDWRYNTLVIFNTFQYVLAMETFLSNYKQSTILKFGKFIPRRRHPVPQYVIFGQDATRIIDLIKWLDKTQYDNSGKYVIICTAPDYEMCGEKKIFKELSKVLIINVVYMRVCSSDNFLSFSYEIVLPGECINSKPYLLNITENCANDDCLKDLYSEKLKNFNRCPLIISTFEQPPFMYINNDTMELSGGDGEIITLVANVLNATLIVKTPVEGNDWGQYENNNWTGSLGDVFNGRVHLSVCALPVSENKYGNFQISFVYNTMDIVWTAQWPPMKPVWQKLLNPFQMDLRIAVLFIFACIVAVNALAKSNAWRKFRRVINARPLRRNLFFYSWALFLGMPILRMPSKRPFLLIVYSWIWFCFVVKSAYQGALINSLKNQIHESRLPNFESVLQSKYPYGGIESLREYYIDDTYIYDNWIPLDFDDTIETLDSISNARTDFVLAINKDIIVEHLMENIGLRHLQIIPEKIVNSPTVMYFKKYSVLAQPISHVLSLSVESGFTQQTYTRYLRNRRLFVQKLKEHHSGPLTFDNFKACMALLIFGWSLSLIFFAVEAYCGRLEAE